MASQVTKMKFHVAKAGVLESQRAKSKDIVAYCEPLAAPALESSDNIGKNAESELERTR